MQPDESQRERSPQPLPGSADPRDPLLPRARTRSTALAKHVFPAPSLDGRPDQPIRVWVSGCATGEEAYSVAIACSSSCSDGRMPTTRVQIFATDVSETAIEHARAGVYPASIEADVSAERLRRFFTRGRRRLPRRQDGARPVRLRPPGPHARSAVLAPRPDRLPQRADLPGRAAAAKLLSVFHYALKPAGFLMLGQAETRRRAGRPVHAGRQEAAHPPQEGRPGAAADDDVPRSITRPAGVARGRARADDRRTEKVLQGEAEPRSSSTATRPPGVVVDADLQIVQFRGQTGRVPRARAGRGQPEPAEDGRARGCSTACAARCRRRARAARPVRKTRPAGAIGDALDAGDARRHPARRRARTAPLPRAVRREPARRAERSAPAPTARPRPRTRPRRPPRHADAAARAGGQPRVPAVDHPGARGRQRGAAVGQRGDPLEQRGAAVHQRGARHREGGAAVHQRGAEHGQRGAARPQRGAEPRQQRPAQPARQRADRHRDRQRRPAHPPLHADGREAAEPDPRRRRPADRPHQARTSTARTSSS